MELTFGTNNTTVQSGGGTGTVTQVNSGAGLVGGPITTAGTLSFAPISAGGILSNLQVSSAVPVSNSLTAILDTISSLQGSMLVRGAASWQVLSPSVLGYALKSQGPTAIPAWGAIINSVSGTEPNNG